MAESENVEKLPSILDGTFFKVIKIANGKVVANCLNCINNQRNYRVCPVTEMSVQHF